MEKDLHPDVIKTTQNSLGKYVKRPPLSEKLLKKPPFRFLHDIVTTVLKTTGFFDGLFEAEELISDNVKDRDSKILFLNKVISVVELTTGKALSIKPSKIVAGQESEKTNELLQCLAQALDKNLSSEEAVRKFKEGTKSTQPTEKKIKEQTKPIKKSNDGKKLTSSSSEKLTSNKRDPNDRTLAKNEKDKVSLTKVKQKENSTIKKESPPKKTSQPVKTITKKNSVDKPTPNQNDNIKQQITKNSSTISIDAETTQNVTNNDRDHESSLESQDLIDTSLNARQTSPRTDREDKEKFNASYTIAENDLNSSLSSQDLMEVDKDKIEENDFTGKTNDNDITNNTLFDDHIQKDTLSNDHNKENVEYGEKKLKSTNSLGSNSSEPESLTKQNSEKNNHESITQAHYNRPTSVRPSSSRPGAPRLRDKHDNVVSGTENLLVGKVNIIVENTQNEEEEESSIIIVEQQVDSSITQEQDKLQLASNQHGHLVQQILESQKELSHITGKTEIEWQFGAQKAREALNQEIEQLKFNIQALSRVANPLGKLMDHIQEDVEVMRQELQQWTKSYDEASKELIKQKTANEDSLFPLHTKLKQLDVDIEEKHDKINDLKIVIHKNSSRIEKLLATGIVQ